MTHPVLVECAGEIRRLAVAGSGLAVGDFRLKRLVDPLHNQGRHAPVLERIAQSVENLVDGNEKDAPENLLRLAGLVNAVLYTQGKTGIEGELEIPEFIDPGLKSLPLSARLMKSLLEALTSTGSGRFETIRTSHEQGYFRDIRMVEPALNALDDRYSEIADYMTETVLPAYGPAILPLLREKLDMRGGRTDSRRLRTIFLIQGTDAWPLLVDALENGSKEVKIAALNCLAGCREKSDAVLPILVREATSRNKEVRRNALEALGKFEDGAAADALIAALDGDDTELVIFPVRSSRHPRLLSWLIREGKNLCHILTDPQTQDADRNRAVDRFMLILSCFHTHDEPETEAFLVECFKKREALQSIKYTGKSGRTARDMVMELADLLGKLDTKAACEALVSDHENMDSDMLVYGFRAAIRHKKPAWVYEQFSPLLTGKTGLLGKLSKKKPDKEKARKIASILKESGVSPMQNIYATSTRKRSARIDPRWLDTAVQAQDVSLVCCLVGPGDRKAAEYLARCCQQKFKGVDEHEILWGLIRAEHPEAVKMVLETLQEKMNQPRYYNWHYLVALVRFLPPDALPELEAFARTVPEKFADDFAEALSAFRERIREKA